MDIKPGTNELAPATNLLTPGEVEDINGNLSSDMNSTNKVPTMLYFQYGKKTEVINSTIFLYKALDFYSKEFGSFPFTSYTLVFIEDLPVDICGFAGLTLASDRLLYTADLIEPMERTTELLSAALAEQYSGINVLPKSFNDFWLVLGHWGINYFGSQLTLIKISSF
ncbi:unnamed protein product [Ambrosiozyma monospora]|uniref:Unnamed protein product n=1 Tax=Ambrosiozyma monospora TaxID=43982 RepID=A0ACB5U882_AMBMO|nr:unnamed protein product [Ambrosiozyma monospora]